MVELVYLWVDKYKNIQNQGFNFSSRFTCKYEDGELTIDEKEHVSIFPENINITAIVGENGSGKSSIVTEIINNIIFHTKIEYKKKAPLLCFLNDKKNIIYIYSNLIKDISKVISKFDFKITHLNDENLLSEIAQEYESTQWGHTMKISKKFNEEYYKSFFYLYNNSLEKDDNLNKTYEYNEKLLFFSEINKSDNIINLENETEKTYKYLMTLLLNQNRIPKHIKNFFVPTRLFLTRELWVSYFEGKYGENGEEKKYHDLLEKNPDIEVTLKIETLLYLKYFIKKFNAPHSYREMKEEIEALFEDINILESYENIYDDLTNALSQYLSKIQFTKENMRYDDNQHNDSNVKELNELENILELLQNTEKLISLIKKTNNDINDPDYEIDVELLDETNLQFLKKMPAYLKTDFAIKTGKRFEELSSGEKNLLKLMFSIEDIIQKRKDKTDSLYILLDEIETAFHPDWQKRILNWLIEFVKHYDMQINIIVATHSPFILSDLPKENIIFLEKYKKEDEEVTKGTQKIGNCKNVTSEINIETFGANIHTLLSHGFFMEDGLMGEFAKEKINDVIKVLISKRKVSKKNKKYYKHLISLIGEPFLREKLLKMYDEKFQISKEARIQELEKELAELKK